MKKQVENATVRTVRKACLQAGVRAGGNVFLNTNDAKNTNFRKIYQYNVSLSGFYGIKNK
jgi:hypothetical protein